MCYKNVTLFFYYVVYFMMDKSSLSTQLRVFACRNEIFKYAKL